MARPQIISHRGATDECPENTLPAFLRALALGADAIELDVHATRDGIVVVHHDPTLRVRDSEGRPSEMSIADMDVAAVERVALAGGQRIPTLAAVLHAVGGRATVYIEIKGRGIEQHVVDAIGASPAPAGCAVHSFDHRAVQRVRRLAPSLRTGILLASYLVDPVAALSAADAVDYWSECSYIDEDLVRAVHAAGGRVVAWTVRDATTAIHLTRTGVDGLCTDDVAETIRALSTLE